MDLYNLDNFDIHEVEDRAEYKFARDLIRYVLETRMKGLNWKPEGLFERNNLEESPEYPFTAQIEAVVKAKLDRYENKYHGAFDNSFPNGNVDRKLYLEVCKRLRSEFLCSEFSIKDFFRFSVVLAKYAGLAYLFGILDGPQETLKIIVSAVRHLVRMDRVVDDEIWNELQEYALDPDLEEADEVDSDDTERTETSSESGRQPL